MTREGNEVYLGAGDSSAKAFLVEPDGEGRRPAIIVIHEWWGLNDHIKDIAGRFAGEGYVAIAPDLYGGKVAKDPEEAGKLMQGLDQEEALKTLDLAVEFLRNKNNVAQDKIGVTGFCMGGTYALLLPSHNKKIAAAAPFYGDVPPSDRLKELSAPILFIGAENDFWITADKIDRLREALSELKKEGEVVVYEGVGHAFFNDTRPDAYDEKSAADAWERVTRFFAEKLKS